MVDFIEKGKLGEEFVTKLMNETFLSYWCYPNPMDEKGSKKEICDLLVMFGRSLIIISIKYYEFKGNYQRYIRQSIGKAIKQVYGAERKLFETKSAVFIKHPDKKLEKFDKNKFDKIYRIIINLGEGVGLYPICVTDKKNKPITIFDGDAFIGIIKELDTFPDLFKYLESRVNLFSDSSVLAFSASVEYSNEVKIEQNLLLKFDTPYFKNGVKYFLLGSENDLLAVYLNYGKRFPNEYNSKKSDFAILDIDREWKMFINDPQVKAKKKMDELSYFIDELVKRELFNQLDKTNDKIAENILSLDRYERRVVSKSFFDFMKHNKEKKGFTARRFLIVNETISLLFFHYLKEMPEAVINQMLKVAQLAYTIHYNYPSQKVVTIACSPNYEEFKFLTFNVMEKLSNSEEINVMISAKKLGWFRNIKETRMKAREYPE